MVSLEIYIHSDHSMSYRISGFFRVHPFSALFARISKTWKMHSRKFDTVSCKSGKLWLLLWFREILIRVDLIHGFLGWNSWKKWGWRVNNLIYGNWLYYSHALVLLYSLDKWWKFECFNNHSISLFSFLSLSGFLFSILCKFLHSDI